MTHIIHWPTIQIHFTPKPPNPTRTELLSGPETFWNPQRLSKSAWGLCRPQKSAQNHLKVTFSTHHKLEFVFNQFQASLWNPQRHRQTSTVSVGFRMPPGPTEAQLWLSMAWISMVFFIHRGSWNGTPSDNEAPLYLYMSQTKSQHTEGLLLSSAACQPVDHWDREAGLHGLLV